MVDNSIIENRRRKFELLNPNYIEISNILLAIQQEDRNYKVYNLVKNSFMRNLYFDYKRIDENRALLYEMEKGNFAYKILVFSNGNTLRYVSEYEIRWMYEDEFGVIIRTKYNIIADNVFVVRLQILDKDTGRKLGEVDINELYLVLEAIELKGYGRIIHLTSSHFTWSEHLYINRNGIHTLDVDGKLKKVKGIKRLR